MKKKNTIFFTQGSEGLFHTPCDAIFLLNGPKCPFRAPRRTIFLKGPKGPSVHPATHYFYWKLYHKQIWPHEKGSIFKLFGFFLHLSHFIIVVWELVILEWQNYNVSVSNTFFLQSKIFITTLWITCFTMWREKKILCGSPCAGEMDVSIINLKGLKIFLIFTIVGDICQTK